MKTQLLFAALAAVLLAGCTKDNSAQVEDGNAPQGEFVSVTLPVQIAEATVTPPSAMSQGAATPQAATRGAAQPASSEGFTVNFEQPAAAETTAANAPSTRTITQELTNVWVLQFNNAGQATALENTGTLASGAYLTAPRLQVGTGYTLYIVANSIATGFTMENAGTLATFERTMFHTDAVTDAAKLPVCGKLTGVTILNLGDGTGKIKLADAAPAKVVMNRIQAEVTLTVDFGVETYTLAGAELYNVPIGATYGWNDTMTSFPDNTIAANFNYTDLNKDGLKSVTTTTEGTKTTFKWFVGENRRGEVAGLTAQTDRNTTKAPAYATFARIRVENEKCIMYDVYLGSGAVTNFDIKRNMTYTQTATIKGPAAFHETLPDTDARVSSKLLLLWLADTPADSPFGISLKAMASSPMNWAEERVDFQVPDIFDGKGNFDKILALDNASVYTAAQYCRKLGGVWYLPAKAQLALIWAYLPAIPEDQRPTNEFFWSSTASGTVFNYLIGGMSLLHGGMLNFGNDMGNVSTCCIRDKQSVDSSLHSE